MNPDTHIFKRWVDDTFEALKTYFASDTARCWVVPCMFIRIAISNILVANCLSEECREYLENERETLKELQTSLVKRYKRRYPNDEFHLMVKYPLAWMAGMFSEVETESIIAALELGCPTSSIDSGDDDDSGIESA